MSGAAYASPRAALPAPLPCLCTAATVPAGFKGLETTSFVKQTALSVLLPFAYGRVAEGASLLPQGQKSLIVA